MELIKKELKYFEPVFNGRIVHEESADMIVPDSESDVKRIAGAVGNVYIKEKSVQNDRVLISGVIKATVFYMPEEGQMLKSINIPVNFAHIEDVKGISPESMPVITAQVRNLDASMLNPRKLSVKTGVVLDMSIYDKKTAEISSDVQFDSAEGVQVLKKTHTRVVPVGMQEKNFAVLDNVEMSDGGNTSEIIVCGAVLKTTDVRVVSGKAVVKGQADFDVMYKREDGELLPKRHSFNFSQIIEMPGIGESTELNCAYSLKSAEFERDAESEGKYWDMRASVDMIVSASEKKDIEVLSDLYSTAGKTVCTNSSLSFESCGQVKTYKKDISDNIETAQTVGTVLHTYACFGERRDISGEKPSVNSELYVNVLFTDSNGEYHSASKIIPVSFEVDGGVRNGAVFTENAETRASDDGKLQIKANAVCNAEDTDKVSIPYIETAELSGEDIRDVMHKNASVILRYAAENEDLWSVAKRYGSTVSDIEQANAMRQGESIQAGRLILIPLKQ